MKVFQELRTAIDEWEQNNSILLKLCNEFDCNKSELVEMVRKWKQNISITNSAKILDTINKLIDSCENAESSIGDVGSQVDSAMSEIEYVDASDAEGYVGDIAADLASVRDEIIEQLPPSKDE